MKQSALVRKLHSNEGASLMVALLFFVMAATIGSIILAAATASSGRLAGLVEQDQTYFAASSAANLMTDVICGSKEETDPRKNHSVVMKLKFASGEVASIERKLVIDDTDVGFTGSNGLMIPDMFYEALSISTVGEETLKGYFTTSTITSGTPRKEVEYIGTPKVFNLTLNGYPELNVQAKLYITKDLDILVNLIPMNKKGELAETNQMNLWFNSVKKLEENVTEGDLSEADPTKKTITKVNIYSTYWEKPFISKGELSVKKEGE